MPLIRTTIFLLLTVITGSALAQQADRYSPGGTAQCVSCHEANVVAGQNSSVMDVFNRSHGQKEDSNSPMASRGCETCHGPSFRHAVNPTNFPPKIGFTANSLATVTDRNVVCLDCHQNDQHRNWDFSSHAIADVACADCHQVHSVHDRVQERATQVAVCTGCHLERQADLQLFSHHPIGEGQLVCSDCHAPHGGDMANMLNGLSINDTCTGCHAEKRGPFLFEHAPVQDDCTNCHNPHGSVNDNLLTISKPFLCQSCHIESRHPGVNYANQDFAGNNRVIGNACTNCHTQIHGSNHPAGMTMRR